MIAEHFKITNNFDRFTIAVDFDGCLAGDDLGVPNVPLVDMLMRCEDRGYRIIVVSARPPTHTDRVHEWMEKHDLLSWQVMLGVKPAADVFIDDRGLLPPMEALEAYIERAAYKRDVRALTLGHDQSPLGLQMGDCWENPNARAVTHDQSFVVTVPVSAGVDSTTCWAMALRAGLPVVPVYVDTGAAYASEEMFHVEHLHSILGGEPPQRVVLPIEFEKWKHVDRARNAVIVLALANAMTDQGRWGEIWFGNIAEWAETPVHGGDKSLRWLLTMQQLLTLEGHDVRLFSPLGAMGKVDAARWMMSNGYRRALLATRSCYDVQRASCGHCRSCFRRWLAFEPLGLNESPHAWPDHAIGGGQVMLDFRQQARELRHDIESNYGTAEWSKGRLDSAYACALQWLV